MLTILLCATTIGLSACGSAEETKGKEKETKAETVQQDTKKDDGHWDYEHQEAWSAESGNMQSPINLDAKSAEKMHDAGKVVLNYKPETAYIEDNGHSIQAGGEGTAELNGRTFDFKQVHFHAESEHTVDGKHYPIEAHFVNASKSGRLAVVGVFFKEGKENAAFGDILKNVKKGEKNETAHKVDLSRMLPEDTTDYYHYLGSLTTPPLTENVEWYVLKEPVEVSAEQIKKFKSFYSSNNREIQELNDRVILEQSGK